MNVLQKQEVVPSNCHPVTDFLEECGQEKFSAPIA